jgi:lysyl-tRNA synthetase class 2
MDELARLTSKRDRLALRARIVQAARRFFQEGGFLEVSTPLLSPALIPEEHTHPVETEGGFLLPSPEIHMKRFLAAGYDRVFQIGPCFRKGERGSHHLPEFTMLEWYRARADYRSLAEDCEQLFLSIRQQVHGGSRIEYLGQTIELDPPWPRTTVQEAFRTIAGWDPLEEEDPGRFEQDLTEKVMPSLSGRAPVFLTDFPVYEASLARSKPEDPRAAERFELLAGGLEIANGFSELTDPQEQRQRFEQAKEALRRRRARVYPLPERFLAFLPHLPACAGIALGVDRLVMLFTGASHIDEVIALSPEDL